MKESASGLANYYSRGSFNLHFELNELRAQWPSTRRTLWSNMLQCWETKNSNLGKKKEKESCCNIVFMPYFLLIAKQDIFLPTMLDKSDKDLISNQHTWTITKFSMRIPESTWDWIKHAPLNPVTRTENRLLKWHRENLAKYTRLQAVLMRRVDDSRHKLQELSETDIQSVFFIHLFIWMLKLYIWFYYFSNITVMMKKYSRDAAAGITREGTSNKVSSNPSKLVRINR